MSYPFVYHWLSLSFTKYRRDSVPAFISLAPPSFWESEWTFDLKVNAENYFTVEHSRLDCSYFLITKTLYYPISLHQTTNSTSNGPPLLLLVSYLITSVYIEGKKVFGLLVSVDSVGVNKKYWMLLLSTNSYSIYFISHYVTQLSIFCETFHGQDTIRKLFVINSYRQLYYWYLLVWVISKSKFNKIRLRNFKPLIKYYIYDDMYNWRSIGLTI